MKLTTITVITILFINTSIENFTIKNGTVIWENIQTTDLSDSTLNAAITAQLFAQQTAPNIYIVKIENIPIDYVGAGYKKATAPIICQGTLSANVTIETKQGKYKATATNIQLTAPFETAPTPIETFAIKKGDQYKSPFQNHIAKIINHTLTQKMTVTKSEDW
jgi:hypothetical protein